MDYEELLKLLDIDAPSELEFFEQFADLVEERQDIPYETLAALFEGMEPDALSGLIGGYFEDILNFVPDGEDELYTLLSNIGTTLQSLSAHNEDDALRVFAEEFYKFRTWYVSDPCVLCTNITESAELELTLIEALTNSRVQNFTDDDYYFDFAGALDYPLDEYIVSVSSLLEDDYDGGYDDGGDYRDADEEE